VKIKMSSLSVEVVKKSELPDEITVISLEGSLDTHTFNDFNEKIMDCIKNGNTKIILDFEKLKFISSAGLGTLVGLCDEVEENDDEGFIKIYGLSQEIEDIFDMMGFVELIENFKNLDEVVSNI
jgi:anti-anti-sigma factor